jgi:hypothetical protein
VHGEEVLRLLRAGVALLRNGDLSKCLRSAEPGHSYLLLSRPHEDNHPVSRVRRYEAQQIGRDLYANMPMTSWPARGTLDCIGEGGAGALFPDRLVLQD